ncbi:MAG: ferritin family protein [Thermincola sp.]|jgi:rubrerythrin|nr:ferritin family protein [Thermincola sp.]MDT3702341.1 ferritin family protein [Thermincola sp.]
MWSLSKYLDREIVDLAVEIEKQGTYFYKKLAEKAPTTQIKALILDLADEEEKHRVRFMELSRDLTPVNAPETYPGEYFDYVKITVDSHMFSDLEKTEQLVENARSGLDIVKLAMEIEKDTILFFIGLRNLVLKHHQAIIDDLIMEEQIHLVKISRVRKAVEANDE